VHVTFIKESRLVSVSRHPLLQSLPIVEAPREFTDLLSNLKKLDDLSESDLQSHLVNALHLIAVLTPLVDRHLSASVSDLKPDFVKYVASHTTSNNILLTWELKKHRDQFSSADIGQVLKCGGLTCSDGCFGLCNSLCVFQRLSFWNTNAIARIFILFFQTTKNFR
jgi:hypothetical protein